MALDGDETIRIAQAVIVGLFDCLVLFLLAHVSPNFIALDLLHRNVDDQTAHERGALLASMNQEPQDRVAMQPGDSLGCTLARTLYEQLERENGLSHR